MVGQCSKNFQKTTFSELKKISEFDKSFIKIYNEESEKEYFLKVDIQYTEKNT